MSVAPFQYKYSFAGIVSTFFGFCRQHFYCCIAFPEMRSNGSLWRIQSLALGAHPVAGGACLLLLLLPAGAAHIPRGGGAVSSHSPGVGQLLREHHSGMGPHKGVSPTDYPESPSDDQNSPGSPFLDECCQFINSSVRRDTESLRTRGHALFIPFLPRTEPCVRYQMFAEAPDIFK